MKNIKKIVWAIISPILIIPIFIFAILVVNFIENNVFKIAWDTWNGILDDIFKD